MGHRAHKTRARHGYPAKEQPGFLSGKGKKNKGKAWAGIPKPMWQKPKRDKWKPRHLQPNQSK